jgi:hypothetical protein
VRCGRALPDPRRQPAGPRARGPGRAFGRSRRGGPVDAGQPRPGTLRAGLTDQTPAGTYKAEICGIAVKGIRERGPGRPHGRRVVLPGRSALGHAGQAQLHPRVRTPRERVVRGRSRARTGVVRPPGGTVRFGDTAAARCGEHCWVTRHRQGRSAVTSGGGRVLKLTQPASRDARGRLAGCLNGPRQGCSGCCCGK